LSGDPDDAKFWQLVREAFPLTRERIYFNAGGLGPSPYSVIEAVHNATLEFEKLCETFHERLEPVREKTARFLGADPDEIAFTRNCTEGMNIIARGLQNPLKRGDEVLMTYHEHPGGAVPWLAVAKDIGILVRLFEPGKTAEENLNIIDRAITRKTRVLAISHVTCTTGLRFPAKEVCALARRKGVYSVLDGAQVAGMIPLNLHDLGCDFYCTSGHKWLLGPKGTGIVYVRKEMHEVFRPTFVGAYSESKYDLDELVLQYRKAAAATEYGTRDVAGIIGLGAALDFLNTIGMERVAAYNLALASRLKTALTEVPGTELLTPMAPEDSSAMVTFAFHRPEHTAAAHARLEKQYRIRTRSVSEHRLNAIRISLHVYNNADEIDALLKALAEIVRA